MRQSSFIISFLCLLQVSLNEVAAQYSCSSLSSCSSCTSYAYAGCGWCLTGNYCDSIYTSYCTTLTQYESYCPVDASRSGTGSTSSSSSNSAGAIAGSVVGVLVVVAAIAAFIWYRRRRRAMLYNHNNHREGDPLVKNNPPNATGNSNIWQSQSMEQPKQPVHLMTPTVMVSSPPIQQPMMQPCQPQPQTFQPVPMAPPLQPHQSFQPVPMAPPLQQQQQQQQSQPYSAGPVFSPYSPVPPPFAPPPAQNVQPFSPPVQSFATPPFQPIPVNPPPQQLQQQQPQPFQQYTPLPPPPMQAPPQFAPLPPPVPQRPTTNKDKEHDKDNNKDPKFPVAGAASTMAVGMYIQKDASVKAGEKREKDQEDNDASDDWNRAASIAIAGASVAGSLMPIFGILFDGIATICVMAANARTNQTNCRFMADRCKALEPILQAIQNHWRIIEADQSFEAQQKAKTMLPSFEGTVKEFHSTLLLLEKFSKLSKFQFIFKSSNVKEEFVQQDMRLTHAIETLSLGLTRENLQTSTQILNQLQNHLPYVQEKLDHVLTHVQELRVEQKVEIRAVAQAVEIRSQDVQNALASMKGHIMALKQAGLNKEPAFQEQQLHKLMQLQSNAGDRSPLPPSRSGGNLKHMNGFEIAEDEVELLSEIGRGSFGIVYKGKYRDQDVAVKKLILSGMDSSEARTDFFDEIQRLCSLRHNRLIQAYGACTDPTNPFVVMEWMPRKSLFHCLHSNEVTARPKLKHRLAMSMQLLEGITYLHLCKPTMVHRDIKSANLLVDNSFNCKISDFGLAKTLHQSSDSIAHRTADSSVAGTVAYAAPELFDDSAPPPSTASDMYSVGVVLWELWSNQIPWNQLSPMQIMNLVGIKKKMLSMETIRRPDSECPSELADLIEELMRPYPSERPTAPQSLKRLKAVYALLPPLHKAPVGKSPPPLSNYDSRGSSNSIDSHRSIASTVSMASSTASLDSAASSAQHSRASSIDSERGSLEFKPELKIPLQQLQRLSSEEQSNPASAF